MAITWLNALSRLRLLEFFGLLLHPLGKFWRALGRLALGDGPMLQPASALIAHVGVGQAIGRIQERLSEGDKAIAAFADELDDVADVVSFELSCVQQQDLPRLVANGFVR